MRNYIRKTRLRLTLIMIYIIKTKNIIFDRKNNILSSAEITSISDFYKNELNTKEFKFFVNDKLLKAKNVLINDSLEQYSLRKFYINQ